MEINKGEKLIKYFSKKFPVLDHYDVPYRDSRICVMIMNMTDERFDEIINMEDKEIEKR